MAVVGFGGVEPEFSDSYSGHETDNQRSGDRVATLREVMQKKGLLRGWRWQAEFELPFPIHSSGGFAVYYV